MKIGYSFNLLHRMDDWEDSCPEGVDIFAVAQMNGRSIHQGRGVSWPLGRGLGRDGANPMLSSGGWPGEPRMLHEGPVLSDRDGA